MESELKFIPPEIFIPDKEVAAHILASSPNFTFFYFWHKITEAPIPARPNGQTNEEYLKQNWSKLKYRAQKAIDS